MDVLSVNITFDFGLVTERSNALRGESAIVCHAFFLFIVKDKAKNKQKNMKLNSYTFLIKKLKWMMKKNNMI